MESTRKKEIYDKCKKIVKQWETSFMKSYGRPPSKLDIREADKDVRDAYGTYFKLKTEFLEETLMDVLNEDDDNLPANISDCVQNNLSNHLDSNEESINSLKQNISTGDEDQPTQNEEQSKTNEEQSKTNEEQSKTNEDQPEIDDKVWGQHLNNVPEKKVSKKEKKVDLNSTFAKKLFANSKFSKRNPRKSLNSSRNNSSLNISLSQPTTSEMSEDILPDDIDDKVLSKFTSLPLKTGSPSFIRSQSVNVISHLLSNNSISNRKVDTGWLQRVCNTTGTKLPEFVENSVNQINTESIHKTVIDKEHFDNDDDDDDVISGSDEETLKTYHVPKKIKLSPTVNNVCQQNTNIINVPKPESEIKEQNLKTGMTILETKNQKENIEIVNKIDNIVTENKHDEYEFGSKDEDSDYEPPNRKRKRNSNSKKPTRRKNIIESDESEEEKTVKPKGTVPKTTRRKNKINSDESEEDKTFIKRKGRTPKTKKPEAKKTTKRTPNTRTKKKSEPEPTPETNETEEYEMEYSIKPPPKTVPRFKNIKKVESDTPIDEPNLVLSKQEIAKKKLLKKIESGSLNENYVRIDMKKKVFVRGKRRMNFSKYKKQMWKNKKKSLYGPDMDMGGCDGGELICFKCGKTGHMARACKEKILDTLLPLNAAEEEECLLPSLEEASQMARDSALAVRIPTMLPNSQKESETESKTDNEFDDDDALENYMLHAEIVDESHIRSQQENNKKWMQILEENTVKPLYELNESGGLPETPKEVFEALKQFGHKAFRAGQEQAIMRILCGQSTLVTLSTGSGKSLCYQLPAYLYAQRQNCISLVISPLVSLMDDQVSGMGMFLKAACLHTNQTATQKSKVMQLIEDGEINVLLVSPEAVTSGEKRSGFGSILRKLPPIAFACIDEAHCVSQWSHNFRPSYLVICRVLKERLGIKTILGLTATSTYATSTNILEHIQVPDGRNGVISDIPLPDNLFLSVSSDMLRDAALKNLLVSSPFDEFNSIIVYCTRREECERIASYLRTSIRPKEIPEGIKKFKSLNSVAEAYHAGLPASKRRTVQNAFMNGYLRIVVATVAFGMGINKSDIRGVLHYNMPSSFESYVQEVGRAGRDGLPAHCHLFLDCEGNDQNELRRHIYSNSMDRHVIRKLLHKIFVPCDCKTVCPRHEVAFSIQETVKSLDVPEENISTLLCYLELHERQYLEVLTPVYTMCKIISYGSANNIKKAAKDCPPLAMALALQKKDMDMTENVFEFPVVDIAAAMGWDSGIVKSKLKNLEWITENNLPKRSTLTVEFSNLGFHIRAPGNLSSIELDQALDSLYAKKKEQETTSLKQLQVVHTTLTKVSEKYYHLCLAEQYESKSTQLKTNIRQYFSCEHPLKDVVIENKVLSNESQIVADVRNIVAMYRDNKFTGRAVARIFHGIQSPNYPAVIWGRCKFWRAHLTSDFSKLCQIATGEILKMK